MYLANWKTKRRDKFDPTRKNTKFYKILGNIIKEVIIKVLNHKTLHQTKESLPQILVKTLHRGNP